MTDQELEAIESRANAATPGPWVIGTEWLVFGKTPSGDGPLCIAANNYEFINHARADVPALCAEVRRLKAEADRTVLDGMSAQALVAEIERLKDEAAKNRRVFAWERAYPDGDDNVFARVLAGELCVDIGYEDGHEHAFVYLRDEYVFAQRLDGPEQALDAAEQMIRELGFARDGDTFDRSKVEKRKQREK